MKKSLIALAVLAASGAAMAQSSVTLYGVADIGLARVDTGSTTTNRLDSGNMNGSRWGLKGTEDLGGGLKAIFVLESGFNLDTGAQADTTRLFNRQSYVGFSGGFGTVKLGRQMNSVYSNSSTFDPFGDALAGDSARLLNYQGNRTDNAITYAYAASGFRGEVQYALGEVAGNNTASRTIGGFVGYKAGPIDVVLTSQNTRNATDTDSQKVTLLGGNYDFGIAKAFLSYDVERGFTPLDRRHMIVGAVVPMGAGSIKVSYIKRQDKAVIDADVQQYAIGYTYDLSKRTALYTSYSHLDNGTNANAGTSGVHAAAAGTVLADRTVKVFDIGVRHSF